VVLLGTGGLVSRDLKLITWLSKTLKIYYVKNPFKTKEEMTIYPGEYNEWKEKNFPKIPIKMLMEELPKKSGSLSKLRDIKMPIMIINGSKGILTTKRSIPIIMDEIGSKTKRGILVDGAGHSVFKTRAMPEIKKNISEFITEVLEMDGNDPGKSHTITINANK